MVERERRGQATTKSKVPLDRSGKLGCRRAHLLLDRLLHQLHGLEALPARGLVPHQPGEGRPEHPLGNHPLAPDPAGGRTRPLHENQAGEVRGGETAALGGGGGRGEEGGKEEEKEEEEHITTNAQVPYGLRRSNTGIKLHGTIYPKDNIYLI